MIIKSIKEDRNFTAYVENVEKVMDEEELDEMDPGC